jgi:hypothetical protein
MQHYSSLVIPEGAETIRARSALFVGDKGMILTSAGELFEFGSFGRKRNPFPARPASGGFENSGVAPIKFFGANILNQVAISEAGQVFVGSPGSQALKIVSTTAAKDMPPVQSLVQLELTRCSAFFLFADGSVWELKLTENRANPVRMSKDDLMKFQRVLVAFDEPASNASRGIAAISCGSYH